MLGHLNAERPSARKLFAAPANSRTVTTSLRAILRAIRPPALLADLAVWINKAGGNGSPNPWILG